MRGFSYRSNSTRLFSLYVAAGFLAASSTTWIYSGWPGAAGALGAIALQILVHLPYVLYVQGYNSELSPRRDFVVNLHVIAFSFLTAHIISFVCFLISKLISET